MATLVLGPGEETQSVDARLHAELATVWDDLDRDPDVSVVLVEGPNDEGFLLGGSLPLAQELVASSRARFRMEEHRRFVLGMVRCAKPIVSAVCGRAVGEGTVIALMSDISIVGTGTTLLDRHVPMGVAAGDHAALVWPLLTSMARAKYHLLLGEEIPGEEAERIGLVSRVVADDRVRAEARSIAARLASSPPDAVRWTKKTLNSWYQPAVPAFDASLAVEVLGFAGEEFAAVVDRLAAANRETER
ncbi:enoyl-CoA hydratase-related protein [Nocardioides sp.]|uniref:enoyl-CoA hydratase-related protein n=1 Tax=Nocardioides sp. TaxID=35761 RepID=UPI0025D5838E|nr:enoyl-CoA hydratase-related protein [Nocardioides sp.]